MVKLPALPLALLAAGLWIAPPAQVRADAFAQSILVIDNFRLLNAAGAPYQFDELVLSGGQRGASAGASLNGRSRTAASALRDLPGAANPDIAQQFVGVPQAPSMENQWLPYPLAGKLAGTFGYADQHMSGNAQDGVLGQRATRAGTQAMAALAQDGSAAGQAELGYSNSFRFTMGIGDAVRIAFAATPFSQAYVSGLPGQDGDAVARMSWSVDIMNVSTGQLVFAFQPGELNRMGDVSRSDSFAGLLSYNPGTLLFDTQTPLLNGSESYQLTIRQRTLANAYQGSLAVPEPDGLALFGLALLAMALCLRRRAAARARAPAR